jgi:hypothetical protein
VYYAVDTKYILYFALRAALRAFKFDPVEFSPALRPYGAALRAFKIAPSNFVEPVYDVGGSNPLEHLWLSFVPCHSKLPAVLNW